MMLQEPQICQGFFEKKGGDFQSLQDQHLQTSLETSISFNSVELITDTINNRNPWKDHFDRVISISMYWFIGSL